ncbi:bifunctional riboflavin kinase/FAD synthetase [Leptotrichia sp. oral taxon 879]|uniref:bifunctional riboflavin kinase/FAD synthetase n=1 Tax=Leptotrichia sp. oral taxon 879 TaxID=1227267 RepID=UPI0003ADFC31|nr:bifunctional riboflavin kinase/FAD synthetase [Leptotrichia sp. oral taxon 879]ERK53371.1 riboflavin biosynthesis protein RibF [Leptotrichia sp. oral taxon 879 str. F0557]
MKFIVENLAEIKDIIEYHNDIELPDYNKNLKEIKQNKNIVILGNFDGVHKGHQIILKKSVSKAKEENLKTIVYTFNEYPKNQQTKITTCSEKAYLLNENGIDYLYLEQFEKVRNYTPKEFVEKVLVDTLNAKEVYCGFNFTFGKAKSGDVSTLEKLLKDKNIKLNVQEPVRDKNKEIISSTRVRNYIKEGNFEKVRELLGHNFIILGEVVYGKQLGRVLGFPTANLRFENKIYPEFGVYGVKVHIEDDEKIYNGVMNIGKNPTVDIGVLSVEANIFDFSEDIYGKIILIEVLENIRSEKKFDSIDELKKQIGNDVDYWKNKISYWRKKYPKEK